MSDQENLMKLAESIAKNPNTKISGKLIDKGAIIHPGSNISNCNVNVFCFTTIERKKEKTTIIEGDNN